MKSLTWSLSALALIALFSFTKPAATNSYKQPAQPKIQVAILLDVSGSMNGLIEQAKSQLWNMVTTLGKAQCTDKTAPQVELALYEYGRTSAPSGNDGYVKQLSPFTTDLDEVSKILFSLGTTGGDEFCGQVIYNSIDELSWDASKDNYKVIFIAGNEDFLQGNLHYTKACNKAKDKGVIVNTIYCGSYQQGIAEHWNLLGECGNGSFTNINHNASYDDIPTPYDSTLIVLNGKLNSTYIGYGTAGNVKIATQGYVDGLNANAGYRTNAKRIEAKARSNVYNNASWDLVDANNRDTSFYRKVDKKELPDSLKNKSAEEIKKVIDQKTAERTLVQQKIAEASANRTKYIAEQKAKTSAANNEPTLESEVEKIIKEQVKRFNMKIE